MIKPLYIIPIAASLAMSANAATIGAGVGILTKAGANNAFDTPSDGTTDQSRQNLDDKFFVSLPAGTYKATTWQYNAGQTGQVTPYLAILTGSNAYQIVAVGATQTVTGSFGTDITVNFGGSSTFTLGATTNLYAGITNPKAAGSQNPVNTNLASGFTVDHDNNADGNMSPAVLGGAVDGFGHGDLARSYAFSINVDPVPEPTTTLLSSLGVAGLLLGTRRRR